MKNRAWTQWRKDRA